MSKVIVCAATPSSGVRHRFLVMQRIKGFADHFRYSARMLWGVSRGVSYCRFEELFAPIPGLAIENISEREVIGLAHQVAASSSVNYKGRSLRVFLPGAAPAKDIFAWNLSASASLARLLPRRPPSLVARLSKPLQAQASVWIRRHDLTNRLGIRVRVEELASQPRKPHRVRRELDEVITSIIRIPWHTRVFIATDSEYIQQMLASHFYDARFFLKRFDLEEATGRYVHRQDRHAMFTFLKEVYCLCACSKIINIGGFLNDNSVKARVIKEPYQAGALMHFSRR